MVLGPGAWDDAGRLGSSVRIRRPAGRVGYGRLHGMWRSLVARLLWEQEAAGSNPAIPTNRTTSPAISGRFATVGTVRVSRLGETWNGVRPRSARGSRVSGGGTAYRPPSASPSPNPATEVAINGLQADQRQVSQVRPRQPIETARRAIGPGGRASPGKDDVRRRHPRGPW